MPRGLIPATLLLPALFLSEAAAQKADWPMWRGNPSRNRVAEDTGIPAQWNLKTRENVKWIVPLGSPTYGAPVIAGGKLFIGTNNKRGFREGIEGDKGVMICLDEDTGAFRWQATHDKLPSGNVNDWADQGIPSMPYVERDRLYYVSNRCELVCADVEGFHDGENDGPYKNEKHRTEQDADFVWILDMFRDLEVFPHNLAACSPVGAGDLIFVTTSNGVDESHRNLPSPDAPSLIAVNKNTGKLVWQRSDPGANILHGQWSSPAYGVVNGKSLVVFGAGDGWCYAHEAKTGKLVWKFDLNPKDAKWAPAGQGTKNGIVATPVIHDGKVFLSVGDDPDYGSGDGHLYCIDAAKTGDITETGLIWHVGGEAFQRSISTVAIADGLLYAADVTGFLHCFDVKTGKQHWVHDTFAAIWGSPIVVDGKVMIATTDGEVLVLEHGKGKKLLATNDMRRTVYSTPVAVNGVLYVAQCEALVAIEGKKRPAAPPQTTQPAPRRADWPMFRGDPQLTGVATCDLPPRPTLLWRHDAGDAILSSAAITGGSVFVGCENGSLLALDLSTGKRQWAYYTQWRSDSDDAATSQPAPRAVSNPPDEPGPAIRSSPCVVGETVFFGDEDGMFHAVDAKTGRAKWSFATGAEIVSSANPGPDRVLFGSYDGFVYCLSARDGKLLWKVETEGPVHATPSITGEHVVIAGCDSRLRVVSLSDGATVRVVEAGDRAAASPAVQGPMVYLGTLGCQVRGIDWTTGRRRWVYERAENAFPFHGSAAVAGGLVIIGGRDKMLHGLDAATGKARWTFKTKGRVDSSPVVVGDHLFFGSSDGNLYGLTLETGRERWRFEAGGPIVASPAVGNGRMVVGTEDGMIYCFGARGDSHDSQTDGK